VLGGLRVIQVNGFDEPFEVYENGRPEWTKKGRKKGG